VADGPWRTRRALTAEGVRQLVAVGVAYLLTTGPQLLDADWSMLWSMPLTMVALAVVVLVGHLLPTYFLGRPVWSVTILVSSVLFLGVYPLPTLLEDGSYPGWADGEGVFLLIYLVLPLVVFTTFVRVLIPALRPAGSRMSSAD